jgi:hypothetical protein
MLDIGIAHYEPKMWDKVVNNNLSKLGKDGKPEYREDGKLLKGEGFVKLDPDKAIGFTENIKRILKRLINN